MTIALIALKLYPFERDVEDTLKGEVEGEEKAWRLLPWGAVFCSTPSSPTVNPRPMWRTMDSDVLHRGKQLFFGVCRSVGDQRGRLVSLCFPRLTYNGHFFPLCLPPPFHPILFSLPHHTSRLSRALPSLPDIVTVTSHRPSSCA